MSKKKSKFELLESSLMLHANFLLLFEEFVPLIPPAKEGLSHLYFGIHKVFSTSRKILWAKTNNSERDSLKPMEPNLTSKAG